MLSALTSQGDRALAEEVLAHMAAAGRLAVKHMDALVALCAPLSWQILPSLIEGLMASHQLLGPQAEIIVGLLTAAPLGELGGAHNLLHIACFRTCIERPPATSHWFLDGGMRMHMKMCASRDSLVCGQYHNLHAQCTGKV